MAYKENLENLIRISYKMIVDMQEQLLYTNNAMEKERNLRETKLQWDHIEKNLEEYIPLCQSLNVNMAPDIAQIAVRFGITQTEWGLDKALVKAGLKDPKLAKEVIASSIPTEGQSFLFQQGLCRNSQVEPDPDSFFVAQAFTADANDLLNSLKGAFDTYGLKAYRADQELNTRGILLCKLAAKIQATRFGAYELTANQNRNVYLELGVAIGLRRPFMLLKQDAAQVSRLVEGLDYINIKSYAKLKLSVARKAEQLLVTIADYRPENLPEPGSSATYILAHGEENNSPDFSLAVARALQSYGLTPVLLGEDNSDVAAILEMEGIPYHEIEGIDNRSRLDATIAAIQSARFGVYLIDPTSSPDTFLALGMAVGLNRPIMLSCRKGIEVPADLRGLSTLEFSSFENLERDFPKRFANILQQYASGTPTPAASSSTLNVNTPPRKEVSTGAVSEEQHKNQEIVSLTASGDLISIIRLVLSGNVSQFNDEYRQNLVSTLADVLNLKISDIKIIKIDAGSILVTLEIPEAALAQLFTLSPEQLQRLKSLGLQLISGGSSKGEDFVINLNQPASKSVPLEKIMTDKALIGDYGDALDAEHTTRVGQSVCLIEAPEFGGELGTGFLIAPSLVLTNYHVVSAVKARGGLEQKAAKLTFRFGYRGSGTSVKLGRAIKVLTTRPLLLASEPAKLDFALLQLEHPAYIDEGSPITPLKIIPDRLIEVGEIIWIVQHPKGDSLRFAQGTISHVEANEERFQYNANTEPGSSGSPIFDRHWNLIGLHHSGSPFPASSAPVKDNEGIPLATIWPEIEAFLADPT